MSPTDTKRCGAKRRKNKRNGGLGLASLAGALEIKPSEPASSTTASSSSSPSTSAVASLQMAAIAPISSTGNDLAATATATPLISSERMDKTEMPKKHCGGTINSRQTRKQTRTAASAAEAASQVEPIDLEESAYEEVVDLTCESSEPIVVDLTHNDSVVIVEENVCRRRNRELRSQQQPDSCVLSSDDDEARDNDVVLTGTLPRELELLEDGISSSRRSGTVSCPICMDGYSEIVQSGRLIVSTKCGHVFCSQCLRDSLRNANSCPTCRKKLGYKQYHPIYI
ncbi:E3 ubiquitin-protein ligase RNF4-like [Rhineura floridana]|uniref:E3 ubiquitin-protein ligase RNF4-like n=1 Tax=Rhineura floridana TaxID=261503 RepID=UPI002AC8462F|nr:E3 ubiquitin-protein ligase RNF4-like [Rhineura floridana]XP_061455990.1 E3 ubiquitin-protein ligase RNF4-like [Rhineura floridana]XP_061455999.1 E3 ubiquitin-protein ligase RNF4-like [Rhineura floridana]